MDDISDIFSALNDKRNANVTFSLVQNCPIPKGYDSLTKAKSMSTLGGAMMISFLPIFLWRFKRIHTQTHTHTHTFFPQRTIYMSEQWSSRDASRCVLQECSDFWLMLHEAELRIKKLEKEAPRQPGNSTVHGWGTPFRVRWG